MKLEADAETHVLVRDGVDAYAHALSAAGGQEVEALMRQGGRANVCAAIYASPPYDLRVPPLPVSRLSVNLTQARVSGGIDGEPVRSYEALRYSMFLVPAGVPVVWRKDSPSRHLTIYFHPLALDEGAFFSHEQTLFNTQLAGARQLADQLATELDSADPLKAEAADSLSRLLLVRLARQLCGQGGPSTALTRKMLAQLRDYVTAHLHEKIPVADLARVAGLPPYRFAQAFSECMNQSPHQFVLKLRLEHAVHLLGTSSQNLVQVAHECGFAHQQHLCNAMRRHLGMTPGQYRRTRSSCLK